jgi:hypothetical protein
MALSTAQRRMLVIGLVPLLVLVIGGAAVTVSAIRGKLPYDYSAVFVPGEQGVSVVSDVPVDVMSSPDGQVHVNVDGSYAVQQPVVRVTPGGRLLDVRTTCPDAHCNVDVVVELPTGVGVQVKVQGTSLSVVGVSGAVKAAASDGSIALMNLRSEQVSVDSRRGSVAMVFDHPPDQVTATSTDGSLSIQLPPSATYAIDAVAARGSSDLNIPNDPASARHLYLRTSNGSITVN